MHPYPYALNLKPFEQLGKHGVHSISSLNPVNLRQLKALLHQPKDEIDQRVHEVIMSVDAEVEELREQLLTAGAQKDRTVAVLEYGAVTMRRLRLSCRRLHGNHR